MRTMISWSSKPPPASTTRSTKRWWVKASPQLASWDLTHPTPAGAEVIGDLLYQALLDGYEASRKRD